MLISNLSDSELNQMLIAVCAVAVLLSLPACISAWRFWHNKEAEERDFIVRQ